MTNNLVPKAVQLVRCIILFQSDAHIPVVSPYIWATWNSILQIRLSRFVHVHHKRSNRIIFALCGLPPALSAFHNYPLKKNKCNHPLRHIQPIMAISGLLAITKLIIGLRTDFVLSTHGTHFITSMPGSSITFRSLGNLSRPRIAANYNTLT